MNEVAIYVEYADGQYDRLNMFDDENINIKFKLKDSSDLSKVYSTFSQTFTIPSDSKNNRLLNYFFNTEVSRDSSRYLKAKIYVNQQLFKVGFVQMNEGKFKYGNKSSLSINFFTSITNIKELFGDEILSDTLKGTPYRIKWDDGRAYLYTQGQVVNPDFDPDVIVPLASNKRVWTYNDNGINDIKYTNTISGVKHIESNELRPAIPFSTIMNKIAENKGLTFNSSLFDLDEYKKLYVWCNARPNKTVVQKLLFASNWSQISIRPYLTVTSTPNTNIVNIKMNQSEDWTLFNGISFWFNFQPKLNGVLLSEGNYKFRYYNNDTGQLLIENTLYLENDYYTNKNSCGFISRFAYPELLTTGLNIRVELELNSYLISWAPTDTSSIWSIRAYVGGTGFGQALNYTTTKSEDEELIDLFNLLPSTKTVDFLMSFIKCFNLTIIEDLNNPNIINFVHKNDFYLSDPIDFTEYIDIKENSVKPTTLYKRINFKHNTSDYKSNKDFKNGNLVREFGEYQYTSGDVFLKDEYKIETQFSIVPNRILPNTNTYSFYGFKDEKETNSTYGTLWTPNTEELTIFYYNGQKTLRNATDTANISFNFKIYGGGGTIMQQLTTYNKVSITYSDVDDATYVNSLAFSVEIDAFNYDFDYDKTLFINYYASDIDRIYNNNSRLFTYNMVLPPSRINDFKLSDIIIVNDKKYTIEEADINIINGKSKLTLMNISPRQNIRVTYPTTPPTPPTSFTGTLI